MRESNIVVFALLLATVLGCKFLEKNPAEVNNAPKTAITRELLLERLEKKGVKQEPARSMERPNVNVLYLVFDGSNNKFKLNNEIFEPFTALLARLIEIRRVRESNGLFAEGTNEVYKKITLLASPMLIGDYNSTGIFVEDFEKLVDDLKKEGFDQLELTFTDPMMAAEAKPPGSIPETDTPIDPVDRAKLNVPSTISGGVVNGKASNLVKPEYPAAARAVRASGAVSVEVLIDEKGDVVSATAVSGHPLLRASAVSAAKESKFTPTRLSGKPVKVKGIVVYNFQP